MSDLRLEAQLVTAIFDLSVVQGIRAAVRTNTLRLGGYEGPLGNIDNPKPPPSLPNFGIQHHPGAIDRPHTASPVIERRVVESTGRCDCDRDSGPATAASFQPLPDYVRTDETLPATDAERASGIPARRESPFPPPWAQPLPIEPPACVKVVKYEAQKPDLVTKGLLLDFFM